MHEIDKEINLLEVAERGEIPCVYEVWISNARLVHQGKITNHGIERLAKLRQEKEKKSRQVVIEDITCYPQDCCARITLKVDPKSRQEIYDFLRDNYGTTTY